MCKDKNMLQAAQGEQRGAVKCWEQRSCAQERSNPQEGINTQYTEFESDSQTELQCELKQMDLHYDQECFSPFYWVSH